MFELSRSDIQLLIEAIEVYRNYECPPWLSPQLDAAYHRLACVLNDELQGRTANAQRPRPPALSR